MGTENGKIRMVSFLTMSIRGNIEYFWKFINDCKQDGDMSKTMIFNDIISNIMIISS